MRWYELEIRRLQDLNRPPRISPPQQPHPEPEAWRQAQLLRQSQEYLITAHSGGRLKGVRKEALVSAFTEAYRAERFQDILTVGRTRPKCFLGSSPDRSDVGHH